MLDTIAWDTGYLANPEVEKAWSFIGEHADSLLYSSRFTRDRFNFRFHTGPSVIQAVTHRSLEPQEYRDPRATGAPEAEHLLVLGSYHDHEAVGPTIELLSRAFPFQPIRAFGARQEHRRNVTVLESRDLPESEVDRVIATARAVIFPSYHEGNGLPVLKALAYGRPVVVRASPLWHELATLTRSPGRLVEFDLPQDLVLAVGRILAGEDLPTLPFGAALAEGEVPWRWRDCAARLIEAVEQMVERTDATRWYSRDRALRLAQL